jgi:hypothetical protein
MTADPLPHQERGPLARANWVLTAFLAIGAFFLFTEHRAHLLGILPVLLLLACPLLHLFMHGGHGDGHAQHAKDEPRDSRRDQP